MSLWLSGIGVSRGIGIGRVQRLHGGDLEIPEYTVPAAELEHEVTRFVGAQRRAKEQLHEIRGQVHDAVHERLAGEARARQSKRARPLKPRGPY